jgi:transcriptional regulator with XRE-family HTH domain
MESADIQQLFFQKIKENMPAHLSFVDEIAELLNISNDSVYRRIRAEKPISFEEIQKLCSHYKVSLDQFLHLQSEDIIFTGRVNNQSASLFEDYLKSILQQFQVINSFEKKHFYVLMKDIPPFVHFQIPELAKFKFYFWMKSIMQDERLKKVLFYLDDPRYDEYLPLSYKVIQSYNTIPVTEIWNIESINSTLRQIDFYRQSGMYQNKNDIKILYQKVEELVNHIERQAELGVKFLIGTEPGINAAPYDMFVNELILGDNTFLAEIGNMKLTYLNHSILYFVGTRDEQFNEDMLNSLTNLMQKSTQLSKIGEKERVRFFNRLREKIHHFQSALT